MKPLLVVALCAGLWVPASSFAQDENAAKPSSSDDRIQFLVRTKLANDPDVKGGADEVTVANGVVTIKGRVDTEKGKNKASKLTRKVKGVKNVENELKVGPPV